MSYLSPELGAAYHARGGKRIGRSTRAAGLSDRDRRILARTLEALGGAAPDFDEALRALREAVAEIIPSGRTFFLGAGDRGPIVGSLVSGVGLAAGPEGVIVVRVDRFGRRTEIASLA
jgi:hypothetical protein